MLQVIAQAVVEAAKAAILVVRETGSPNEHIRITQSASKMIGPALKQPTVDWKAPDEYNVRNMFLTKSCNIQESKKVTK